MDFDHSLWDGIDFEFDDGFGTRVAEVLSGFAAGLNPTLVPEQFETISDAIVWIGENADTIGDNIDLVRFFATITVAHMVSQGVDQDTAQDKINSMPFTFLMAYAAGWMDGYAVGSG